MSLAERVKARRQELGMSQTELAVIASQLGDRPVSQQSIAELEANIVHSPRALPEIAAALKTTVDELRRGKIATALPVFSGQVAEFVPLENTITLLPLYPTERGATAGVMRMVLDQRNGRRRKYVRPPRASGVGRMTDRSMSPAFEPGDELLLDARGPQKTGHNYVFCDAVAGAVDTVVGLLTGISPTTWTVQQWNPKRRLKLSRQQYPHIVLITGVYLRRS